MMSIRVPLVSVCALLLCACAGQPPASPSPPAPHRVLLVSIDGLRADALDRGITPQLSRLATEGVRARWMNPSYPSLTFPNHYSIVTGLRPDRHGIVNNTMHDRQLGGFKLSNRDAVSDARWWGGEPVWVGAEKAGIRSATWSWPGSEAAIAGIRPSRWQSFDDSVANTARVDTVLGWMDEAGPDTPRLLTLYFDQVDHDGHDHGPDSPQYARAVADVDAAIGHLRAGLQQRALLERTDIVIVSDHGMAASPPQRVIALEDMVPPDLARVVTGGQSVGIEPLPGKRADAEDALLGAHDTHDCWRREDLPSRWHYGRHPRVPAIVCQMHEGWDAVPAERIARRQTQGTRGAHGYDPAAPSMRAVFIARGPSFVAGRTLEPFDNVDVYPLLTQLLGIPAAPNDGDPRSLRPALRDPGTEARQAAPRD